MFYLIWEMGILLLLAVGFGVFVGYQLWSGDARSAEADTAIAENARLRQENENLARRLGEASSQARQSAPAVAEPAPAPKADTEDKSAAPAAPKAEAAEMAKPKKPSAPKPSAPKPTGSKPAAPKPAAPKPAQAKPKPANRPAVETSDLSAIKGIGPKAAAALKAGGIMSVGQIAAWTDADIARWDETLNGRGRIVRDDWVGQAKVLTG